MVRTLAPLIAVLPAASVLRLLSLSPSVLPPTAPPTALVSVVRPLSLIVRLRLPPVDLTVPSSVMATPLSVVSAPKAIAPV